MSAARARPAATAPPAGGPLGAHVSVAGGVARCAERATAIGATAVQIFTKAPSQWKEPAVDAATAEAFRAAVQAAGLAPHLVVHDSYLINLASPDATLRDRSIAAFTGELRRCIALGVPWLVSHPGNFMDDHAAGLRRNAEAIGRCLADAPGATVVCLETTAGTGTALGRTFEELAELRARVPAAELGRIAFCADTCHLFSAGYDLREGFDAVWSRFDDVLGLDSLKVLHLNDSKTPFASRKDRHELIGEGSLGPEPFRRLMQDPRFARVIKIIETPKGDDEVTLDRRMLRRLRTYARGAAPA
ncbi:MAG: deoxyribonuclease IV [Gemmatimonadales bacterium]|nr:deoxyribonuclease IV [Gemmatimonadales bacterium]